MKDKGPAAPLAASMRGSRPQFTAVILADVDLSAQTLYPLTHDLPKSLLPLANRPLLQYQLDLLQASGFSEAVVVTTRDAHDRVQIFMTNEYRGDVGVDLVAVDDHYGTADMLRAVKDRIKGDFLVLTGDLVLGRPHLRDVIELHRTRRSDATFLFKKVLTQGALAALDAKGGGAGGGKKKGAPVVSAAAMASVVDDEAQLDFIGLAEEKGPHGRVVMKVPSITVESSALRASKALLRRVTSLTLHSGLMDSNLYLLSHWVLELIEHKGDFTSLEEDVLPFIVRQQFKGPDAFGPALSQPVGNSEAEAMVASLSAGRVYGREDDGPRCYALIIDATGGGPAPAGAQEGGKPPPFYCSKITSVKAYMAMNRELLALPREIAAWEPPEGLRPKEGCVVGEGCQLGEQVNIKSSVIGAGCKIGTRVKIHQCVLMDNVTVQDGVTLQNTVVAPHAIVQEFCSLTDVFVGSYMTVPPKTKQKGGELMRD